MAYENHRNVVSGKTSIALRYGNMFRPFNIFVVLFYACNVVIYFAYNKIYTENISWSGSSPYPELIKYKGMDKISTLESEGISYDITLETEEISHDDTIESSSACILVSDDNHLLIEWIAYHFHVLNLRHLIITTDPSSRTSPKTVLKRWQGKMKIELWNDTQVLGDMNITRYTRVESNKRKAEKRILKLHRLRQLTFNKKCLRHLKRQNKGWVLLSDSDEYITINPSLHADGEQYSIKQPGSVMAFLQNMSMPRPSVEFYTPCIPIVRRQYSAQESRIEDVNTRAPPKFNALKFSTLRWRKWIAGNDVFHNPTGQECTFRRKAGPGKSIIDLARLRYKDLFHQDITGNVHRPLESICSFDLMFPKNTGLMIHHYLGTFEQWTYRSDSRGDAHRWGRYAVMRNPQRIEESDAVNRWLKGFIEVVGDAEASRLLEGVGDLEPLPKSNESESTLSDPEPNVEVYKVGELVQVYSKKNWKKEWRWGAIREAGKYYNIVFLQSCKEILGVSIENMRRNGTVDGEDILTLLANVTNDNK